jgi:hypothetical protein
MEIFLLAIFQRRLQRSRNVITPQITGCIFRSRIPVRSINDGQFHQLPFLQLVFTIRLYTFM